MAVVDLDGRTALVTGAGGGLGRAHALELAARGARVVVNDLGGASQDAAAAAVVDEIEARGGTAVAVEASVADQDGARAIVDAAIEQFGQLDIVVNNAGILRDRSFPKLEEQDLRQVLDVHLVGTFLVSQAAWPHLKGQEYGRIVNTTSPAGLFGNFGQANYAAAKAGIIGLTQTLAIEGRRSGILVNVVAPLAATRMTESILPGEVLDRLDPGLVSPVVAYLASEACDHTGGIFTAGGGFVGRTAMVQGEGVSFPDGITADGVAGRWADIVALGDLREFPAGAGAQSEWVVERGAGDTSPS